MKETKQHIAVRDATAQADLTIGPQRALQGKCLQAIPIVRHHLRVSAIAAENQPAHFTFSTAARVMRLAIAEIKSRSHDRCLISAPVLKSLPLRIPVKS